jgi:hypothetical protein
MTPLPSPPELVPMTHIDCAVGALVMLGPGPYGERRFVPRFLEPLLGKDVAFDFVGLLFLQ